MLSSIVIFVSFFQIFGTCDGESSMWTLLPFDSVDVVYGIIFEESYDAEY